MNNPSLCEQVEARGFIKSFMELIEVEKIDQIARVHHSGIGRRADVGAHQVVLALVYHFFEPCGYLSAHFKRLWKKSISDAALSKRRLVMGYKVFEDLLASVLEPLADTHGQPECFYRGLRLMGVDGTEFSVSNTPALLGQVTKAASRRLESAFGKLAMCVLVELGSHNPVAAAIGEKGNCELALSRTLWDRLPESCLLIADRLYGTGRDLNKVLESISPKDSHLLVRVRKNFKPKVLEVLSDGSALVEVNVINPHKQRDVIKRLKMRLIKGRIQKPGAESWTEIRLVTSLLDPEAYPAAELFELYARRWEQELYYKELKLELRGGDLLQSHTLETAMQELAAMVIASALVARERINAGQRIGVEVTRISFNKLLYHVRAVWAVLTAGTDVITAEQGQTMARNYLDSVADEFILQPRRSRSSPRTTRQPVGKWPRTQKAQSNEGTFEIELLSLTGN